MVTILLRPAVFRLGAEELDASILEKNLSIIAPELIVFQLSKNSSFLEMRRWKNNQLIEDRLLPIVQELKLKDRIIHALVGDPASRNYLSLGFSVTVNRYLHSNKISVLNLISSNSSLLGVSLTIKTHKRVSRSVNFEPLHYLQENYFSFKLPIVFLLKIWATFIERIFCDVLSISPNDLQNYRRFPSFKRLSVLPLQQLQEVEPQPVQMSQTILQIGYLGSTYNVKHNREGFKFVVEGVAKNFELSNVHFNIYGVKSPSGSYPSNVTIHGWVEPISSIYELNHVFLVPYLGGTGQQSKFFEPLCWGKLVIANPSAAAGYSIKPNLHYLPALSVAEFSKVISRLAEGAINEKSILQAARVECLERFSKSSNLNTLRKSLISLQS